MLAESELGYHVWASLQHLWYARRLLLRTGQIERFEEAGWAFGEESYTGVPDHQVYSEQLAMVLHVLEPALTGDLEFVYYLNDGREDWWRGLRREDGGRVEDLEELFGEGDDWVYAATIRSREPELLAAYREGMRKLRPNLEFFTDGPEPQPEPERPPIRPAGRLAEAGTFAHPPTNEGRIPPTPHFVLLLDPANGNTELDDVYELFDLLLSVWEGRRRSGTRRKQRRTTFARKRTGRR